MFCWSIHLLHDDQPANCKQKHVFLLRIHNFIYQIKDQSSLIVPTLFHGVSVSVCVVRLCMDLDLSVLERSAESKYAYDNSSIGK